MGADTTYGAIGRTVRPGRGLLLDRGLVAWLMAAALLLTVRIAPEREAPALTRDSFQYLSVANQLAHGRDAQTPLVHYDAERSFGVVPAPMVTFPVGYSAAIAPLSRFLPLAQAALVVNVASVLVCVVLLWWCTGALGLRAPHRHGAMAILVVNAFFLAFAGVGMSELLFTAFALAAVTLVLASRSATGRTAAWSWLAAGVAFGAAYHVRYAGLFFIVGLLVLAVLHQALGRRRVAAGYAAAAAVASALAGVGIARNLHLVGHWLGRDGAPVWHPIPGVLFESVRAADLVLLGPGSGAAVPLLPPRLLLVLLALLVTGLVVWRVMRPGRPSRAVAWPVGFGVDLTILLAVYGACMFYAGVTTNISYGPRMFVPLVPLVALLAGMALAAAPPLATLPAPRLARLALWAAFLLYAGLNLSAIRYPQVDRARLVEAELNARTRDGVSVREVVRRLAGRSGIIVANNGQAVGYVLDRATVSLPGPRYSAVRWNEGALRRLVDRYQAKVVLITAPDSAQPADDDLIPTPFVGRLARGTPPAWLHLEGRAGNMLVYVPVDTDSSASSHSHGS